MNYLEGVRIDYETADLITRLTLIDSLKVVNKAISNLKNQSDLKDYEKEDLKNDLKYQEGLLVAIRYYSTSEQMDELEAS